MTAREGARIEGSWLLEFAPGRTAAARAAIERDGLRPERALRLLPHVVRVRGVDGPRLERLLRLPGLERVVPDEWVPLALAESVPLVRADADALAAAELAGADGDGVRICVVDSGVRDTHEALSGRVDVAAGWDAVRGVPAGADVEGHGTHVASVAAGRWPDGSKQGVAPGATIVPVRACGADGLCSVSAILEGIDHCADPQRGAADVINLSLGHSPVPGPCDGDLLAAAANEAARQGLVVVAASGNGGEDDAIDSPACGSEVMAVGAVYDRRQLVNCDGRLHAEPDEHACFSNAGSELDVVAPGALIVAADAASDTALAALGGTSAAAPHVAGLAALVLGLDAGSSAAEVRALIREASVDLGPTGFDPDFGHGRIDAVATLEAARLRRASSWGDLEPPSGDGDVDLLDWLALRTAVVDGAPLDDEALRRADVEPGAIACAGADAPDSWCPEGDADADLADLLAVRRVVAGAQALACEACAGASAEPTAVVAGSARRAGDVAPAPEGDGRIDVADVLRLLRFAAGLDEPSPEQRLRGDVEPSTGLGVLVEAAGDGRIDVSDALLALRATVGLVEIAWPERRLRLVLDAVSPPLALRASPNGWPVWAEVTGTDEPWCGVGGGIDAVGDGWSLTCAPPPGSSAVGGRISYRAIESVDPTSVALTGERALSAAELAPLAAHLEP
jgi:hypothetical protein